MPQTLGTIILSTPDTPDLAGSPTENAHSPLKSYIPQLSMRDIAIRVCSSEKTRFWVNGFSPPFASVAAAVACHYDESPKDAHVSIHTIAEVACYRLERTLLGCRGFHYGIRSPPSASSS